MILCFVLNYVKIGHIFIVIISCLYVVSCFCSQNMNISLGSSAFNSTQSSLLTTIVTAIVSLRCSYFHLKIMYHSRSEADVAQGASYSTGRL